MPCREAMITNVVSAKVDMTVEDVLELFQGKHIRGVPVVDDNNQVIGLFNFRQLLHRLLPIAATPEDIQPGRLLNMSVNLDHISGMSPWVARRLGLVLPMKVGDLMCTDFKKIQEDTPLREGLRLLFENGSPIPVVGVDGKTLVGIITSQSVIDEIIKIRDELSVGNEVQE